MKAKRLSKLTAWLLTFAMLMTFVPGVTFTAFAAEGDETQGFMIVDGDGNAATSAHIGPKAQPVAAKNIVPGTSVIADGDKANLKWDYVYYGTYDNSPIKWRVLSKNGNDGTYKDNDGNAVTAPIFLLSEYILNDIKLESSTVNDGDGQINSNEWQNSDAQAWCRDDFAVNSFSNTEKNYVLKTTKTDAAETLFNSAFGTNELKDDTAFFISAKEASEYLGSNSGDKGLKAVTVENSASWWWLRSPNESNSMSAGIVYTSGGVLYSQVSSSIGARPAFNLNTSSILFTSAAAGGKPEAFGEVAAYNGSEWKLTILDDSRNGFNAEILKTDDKLHISYSGATTGENEYISALIKDADGNVTYYGRLKNVVDTADAIGTVKLDLSGVTMNTADTLYIFNEQYNGDYKTDYASELKAAAISSEVNAYTITFDANSGSGTMDSAAVKSGDRYTLPKCTFTAPVGKQFKGWAITSDGTVISDTTIAVDKVTTLYAVWGNISAVAPTLGSISDLTGEDALTYGEITADDKLTVATTADSGAEYSLSYQWYKATSASSKDGAAAIPGATEANYAIPSDTETGNYYYYCIVTAVRADNDESAKTETGIVSVAVKKKPVTIDWGTTSFVYDGTEKAVNPTVTNAVSGDTVTLTVTDNTATAAGDYVAKVTDVSDDNYTLDGLETTKAWNIVQSATDYEGGSIKAYKGGSEATEFTYGDTITVKVKPYATGAAASVMLMSLAAPTENQMALYLGDTQISEAVNADGEGYYTMNVDTTQTALAYGNITLSAKYVGNNDMASHSEDVIIKLSMADAVQTTAPSAVQGLIYNGEQQILVTAGSEVTGGTIKYKLADGEYSEELPKAANADTYTVYYKIFGDENHSDSTEQSFTVTVNKKPVTIDWGTTSFVYDRTEKTVNPTVTNAVSGDTVILTVTDNTATAAGDYTASVTGVSNNNYTLEGVEATKAFVIGQKVLYADNINYIADVVYTGEEIRPVIEVMDGNTVLVLDTDYEVDYQNNINIGTAEAIVTFKGNYKGQSKREFTILPKIINTEIPLTAPASNAAPQTTIETDEYTATVVWSPEVSGKFAYRTAYTAAITIIPKANYILTGIPENGYTANGAETVVNEADSGTVTVTYAETGRRPSLSVSASGTTTKNEDGSAANTPADNPEPMTETMTKPDGSATTVEAKKTFVDVHSVNHWATADIDYVYINGLMTGTSETHFAPDSTLTRAMLVTVLYRNEGEPAVENDLRVVPFEDVADGMYYTNAVIWAKQNGIVSGVSETEFAPDENITREQIAAIIFRYAKYKGYDVSVGENTNILSYTDFDSISGYAVIPMQYAVGSGLIKGKTASTLNPLDDAARAEIAAILHRFIEANK